MARHQEKSRGRGAASHAAGAAHKAGEQMQNTMEDVGARMQEGVEAGSRHFAAMGEQAFAAWMRSGNETMQRMLQLNVELATWSREQLDDSMDAVRSLAQCRTVGDCYGVQMGLMRSSMEKSLRHASNVLNLATHAMMVGPQTARQSARPE